MNILFLTLCEYDSIYDRDLYTDLLRVFMKHGNYVYMVSPIEKRRKKNTYIIKEGNSTILRQKIGNIQKTNIFEKGFSTVLLEHSFIGGIKKYFSDVRFDLVLYSTPPITLAGAVKYVKERDNAKTYLQLKDIFPQNAVDIGMMSKGGIKGSLYRYFRKKEKELYKLSDRIGCMSPANVDYVTIHNPEIDPSIVEVCPNSIEVIDKSVDKRTREDIREKYGIPRDDVVFIYGGNLGKPQGIPFFIECIKSVKDINEAFFLVVGDGTEYGLLEKYADTSKQENFKLMQRLPKEDYDTMVGACDVGLIFLDHRFSIPNFPSRIVSYMQAKLPVLACTDPNTDIGKVITEGDFGWWCESNDASVFKDIVKVVLKNKELLASYGNKSYDYLIKEYSVEGSYEIIMKSIAGN